jgi:hypothetical protein
MNDLNAGFLLDIWHDLKEKRLAPVAIGLVVALVAIPTLMMKGDESGGDVPLPVPIPGAAQTGPQVTVADENANSKLESYEARDPFKGMPGAASKVDPETAGSAVAPIDGEKAEETGGGTGGSTGTGVTGVEGTDTAEIDTPSNGGGGDTTTPGTPTTPPVQKETAFYNFRLDIKFGKPGREARSKSAPRMSFFKAQGQPIALFLGVTEDAKHATFLVTPGLNHQGEGVCKPKPTQCNFMVLGIGKEHYFSANDLEYRMELLDINKVKASVDKRARETAKRSALRRAARSGDGGASSASTEQYDWPFLVDGEG